MSNIPFTQDEFLSFTWNGKNSSEFNCFITNDGTKLKAISAPSFSNNFTSPMFHSSSFLTGVSVERKNLTLDLALDGVTMKQYRQFLKWLDINTIGLLQFDYDDYYGYKCKLSQLGEATIHPLGGSGTSITYIITLSITFETVEKNNALSQYTTTGYLPSTESSLSFGTLYNPEKDIELSITRTLTDGIYEFEIQFFNRGDIAVPFNLFITNISSTAILRKNSLDDNPENLIFSLTLDQNKTSGSFFDIEFNSESGAIFIGSKLIEDFRIGGQSILLDKLSNPGVLIESFEETPTILYLIVAKKDDDDTIPELTIQYDKETFVV